MCARMCVEGLLVQMTKTKSLGHAGQGKDGMGRDGHGHGMGLDGMGWDGVGWDGMGWDGLGWDGMRWNGVGGDGKGNGNADGKADGDGDEDSLSKEHMGWVAFKMESVLDTACASHGVKAARGSPGCLALRGSESSA